MVTLRGLRERGELGQLCVSELGAGHEAGVAAPDEGHHQVRELLSGYKYFLTYELWSLKSSFSNSSVWYTKKFA